MEIEEAFKQIGDIGVFQRRAFWSTAIPQIFVAWIHLLNIFVGAIPDFYCYLKTPNESKEDKILNQCSPDSATNPCERYSFSDSEFTSIASEWNLVCENAYKRDLVQSVFMVGLLTGNLVGGYMADKYGRKPTCCIGSFGFLIFGVLSTIATSYEYYLLLRFINGIASGIFGLVSFTFPAEMVGSSYRGYVNFVTSVTFALGISSLPILAYYVRDWRLLSLYSSLPGLFGVYYYFCIVESPRWLYSQGKIEDAENVLNFMYQANQPLSFPSSPSISLSSPSLFLSSLSTKIHTCSRYILNYIYVSVFSPVPALSCHDNHNDKKKNGLLINANRGDANSGSSSSCSNGSADEINRHEVKIHLVDNSPYKDTQANPDGVVHTPNNTEAYNNTDIYNNSSLNLQYNDTAYNDVHSHGNHGNYGNHATYNNDKDKFFHKYTTPPEPRRLFKVTLRHNKRSHSLNRSGGRNTAWFDVVSNKHLAKITLVNMITWFVANTLYYGLTLKMGDLNGNRYLNVAFAGLVEIPACLLTLYFMDKNGRKITFSYTLLLSGFLTFAIVFISDESSYLSVGLALVSKTTIAMAVCVCWMHATEMYPTNIRNKAMSLCSMCGRFGGVCAPMILSLGRATQGRDFLIFGLSSIISGFLSFHLPETLNRNLPETVDDLTYLVT